MKKVNMFLGLLSAAAIVFACAKEENPGANDGTQDDTQKEEVTPGEDDEDQRTEPDQQKQKGDGIGLFLRARCFGVPCFGGDCLPIQSQTFPLPFLGVVFRVDKGVFVSRLVDAVSADDVAVGGDDVAALPGLVEAAAAGAEAVLRVVVFLSAFVTGDSGHGRFPPSSYFPHHYSINSLPPQRKTSALQMERGCPLQ